MSQSLARGMEILLRLGSDGHTLAELAQELGVHKTTVLRLLNTLEREQFVRHDSAHRYSLGSRLFALASDALSHLEIRERARPHLLELSRRVGGQSVHLAALENDSVVYIDKVESTHSNRMSSRSGLTAPIHCTAVGKVLIAALTPGPRVALVNALELPRLTQQTITGAGELLHELDLVKAQGWAMDRAEHHDFINSIAAPVHDADGRVVAAVSVSVPDVLLGADQVRGLVPQLLEATAAIDADALTGSARHPLSPRPGSDTAAAALTQISTRKESS